MEQEEVKNKTLESFLTMSLYGVYTLLSSVIQSTVCTVYTVCSLNCI